MKRIYTFAAALIIFWGIQAQTTVFSDNFESGTTSWTTQGTWGLATSASHSTSHSLTESPSGQYADSLNISATMTNGVNLSSSLSANLSFWAKYQIEAGFDYMYVEVSPDGGTTWNNVATFDDTLSIWTQFTYSLGGYVGNSNVKVRFRFFSDGGFTMDGMFIDDVVITSDTVDNAAPLVLHTPSTHYQGTLGATALIANIVDISGIDTAQLIYTVDGGNSITLNPISITGNTYNYSIPQYPAGSLIAYHFYAVDSASPSNSIRTPINKYLAGNYIVYDNGVTNFVDSISSVSGAAVRISLPSGNNHITSVLIRNYTDNNRPNDTILVHIWSSISNAPGVDLVTPRKIFPTATVTNTSPMTLVDFRADSAALDSISGDIFIGYTVPTGEAWTCITQPGSGGRSFKLKSTGWAAASGNSGASDYHFRCVTQPSIAAPPIASFSIDTTYTPSIIFNSTATGTINTLIWTFGDGGTSTNANTNHTYTTNGSYQVCLKVTNTGGLDSACQNIVISSIAPPLANFSFDTTNFPTVAFTDVSSGNPSQWAWDFGNSQTSSQQNPSHTYTAIGSYHICLTATNNHGTSSPFCKDIYVSTVGIDNAFETANIKIFPNPMTENAHIDFANISKHKINLKIMDIIGKQITVDYLIHDNYIEIQGSKLSSGTYFIKLIVDNKTEYNAKLIVK